MRAKPDGKIWLWIEYKKAYDMVSHSWIINSLKMYKISDEIMNFIYKTMKTWRVELTVGGRRLAESKIQRSIFLGDALSIHNCYDASKPNTQ